MASGGSNSVVNDDDEEDVVWEGSPLHHHLQKCGMAEQIESRHVERVGASNLERKTFQVHKKLTAASQKINWPKDCSDILEIEIAQKIMESELLVQEDRDFLSNFILTDEAFIEYEKKVEETSGRTSSLFTDILLFSGSIAAVAGTILYLSERTRLATTVAAVLPTALAAFSTARMGSRAQPDQDKEQFLKLVDLLLCDMKLFKQMVRRSLNLLQGMELMNAGYLFAINKATGAASTSCDTRLASSHRNASFPALRHATYNCTVQLLEAYREALGRLMEVSPLADYIDLKDHYIAFVDLECFGIEKPCQSMPDGEPISVKALKDAVQLALVQQSEYLRRFSLVFCERVREDNELNKSEMLNQIREMTRTLKKINNKLSKVFEYHQAMGLNSKQRMISLKQRQLQFNFVPLRSLYTSLFSTGLHLQNSLLKVRKMETLFDALEKRKKEEKTEISTSTLPSENQLIEWLRGFQDVQRELNACVGCLEEGVSQINVLKGDEEVDGGATSPKESAAKEVSSQNDELNIASVIEESETDENFDQVFEAFVTGERCGVGFDDESCDSKFSSSISASHSSKILLSELKQVLVSKAEEHRIREEIALERQHQKHSSAVEGPKSIEDNPSCQNGSLNHPRSFETRKMLSETQKVQNSNPNTEELQISKSSNQRVSHSENGTSSTLLSNHDIQSTKISTNDDVTVLKSEFKNGTRSKYDSASNVNEGGDDFSTENGGSKNGQMSESETCLPTNGQNPQNFQNENGNVHLAKNDSNKSGRKLVSQASSEFEQFLFKNDKKTFLSDPFCPNTKSFEKGSNCFDDNFLSASDDLSELNYSNKNVSSDDESASSSSSHPSTIKSARIGLRSNGSNVATSDSNSRSSDTDSGGVNFSAVSPLESFKPLQSQKKFSKKRHTQRGCMSQSMAGCESSKQGSLLSVENGATKISVSEIRSVSTPDLKRLASLTSPYVSLEDVGPKADSLFKPQFERKPSGSSDSSECGSMDELENYTLKTFKRPLRPAAHKKSQSRPRNIAISEESPDVKDEPESQGQQGQKTEEHQHESVYKQRHQGEISEIQQPTGFDASLAAQVVARAQMFGKKFNFLQKEEVFGSD